MRILYFGTGDIGLPSLQLLLAEHEVCGVICQPDKPVGRKLVLTPPATKVLALEHGVPVFQPRRIRLEPELVRDLQPDVAVVMAYGQILPKPVLDAPRLGCVNLHASLLPRHRGASPIQAAILAGDAETGITVMYMDEGLDTGDILLQEHIDLAPGETGGSLHERLAKLAPLALRRALQMLRDGVAPRVPQEASLATHAGKLGRADGVLEWHSPAVSIERRVRAFDPWPGTVTVLPGGSTMKIFPPVEICQGDAGCAPPGTVMSANADGIVVACGSGMLRIHSLQMEGRKRIDAAAFLAGRPLQDGDRLGVRVDSIAAHPA
jgi:methionyl-tRNA formyltransferase